MMTLDRTFTYQNFSCEVALLEGEEVIENEENIDYTICYARKEKLFMARFYARSKERKVERMRDYVYVNPSYGYISIKIKTVEISNYTQEGVLENQQQESVSLVSGFLDERVFTSEEMVKVAVYFLIDLIGDNGYYYNLSLVKTVSFVEYNGE
jgi:hypothetical protein